MHALSRPAIGSLMTMKIRWWLFILRASARTFTDYRSRRDKAFGVVTHSSLEALANYADSWRAWKDANPVESESVSPPFDDEVLALADRYVELVLHDTAWMTPETESMLAKIWKQNHKKIGCTGENCWPTNPIQLKFDQATSSATGIPWELLDRTRKQLSAAAPLITRINDDEYRLAPGCLVPDKCSGAAYAKVA